MLLLKSITFNNILHLHVILSLLAFQICKATETTYQNILENNCIQKCQQNSECESWEYDHAKVKCIIKLKSKVEKSEKNETIEFNDELRKDSSKNKEEVLEENKVTAESDEPVIKRLKSDESFDIEDTKLNLINLKYTIEPNFQSLLNKTGCNVFQNRKYKGKEIYEIYTSTSEECCEVCRSEFKCISWWRKKKGKNSGKCVLIGNINEYEEDKRFDGGYFD